MAYTSKNQSYQPYDETEDDQQQPGSPSIFPGPRQNYRAVGNPSASRFVTSTNDSKKAAQQDRDFSYGRYSDLDSTLNDAYDRSNGEYDRYSNAGDQMNDDLYSHPGYNQNQMNQITQYNGSLDGLQQSQDEADSNYMTGDERSAYFNDPDRAKNQNFRPGYESSIQNDGFDRQNEATQYAEDIYGDNVHPSDSLLAGNYEGKINSALADGSKGIAGALDKQDAAVNKGDLTLTPDFADRYRMSDADKQDMITAAGQDAGAMYRGQIDELGRKAAADGTNAVGVATAQQRMLKQASISGADAMTRARVAANAAQADREMGYQQARVGANQGYSDRAASVAGNRASTIAGQEDRNLGAYAQQENLRQAGVQAANSAGAAKSQYVGNAKMTNARNQANDAVGLAVDQSNRGYAMDQASEKAQSDRNLTAAQQRIAGSQYNQTQRYGRGMDRFGIQSGQQQKAVDAQRADQQEARGYVTNKQGMAQQNSQFNAGQRTGLYGQANQAGNTATGNQLKYDQIQAGKPSFWDRLTGVVSGAAKGAAAAYGG